MKGEYAKGWNAALASAEAIAIQWRDENRTARNRARKREDETSQIMADQLEGAAIECHAIAGQIRNLAIEEQSS